MAVIAAQLYRRWLLPTGGIDAMNRALAVLQPTSIAALLVTLVMLFGFQGDQIVAQPTIILLLAVPILIQVYFNSGLAYVLNRVSGEQHCIAGPSALIGASNFFELAVAARDHQITVTIHHNPACGTSRNTLAMIRPSGVEPVVIEYLKMPSSLDRIIELVNAACLPVAA